MDIVEPQIMTLDGLVAVLEDILQHVRAGDSLEGQISWHVPETPDLQPWTFAVRGVYRIGYQKGDRGGLALVGNPPEGSALND